MKKEILLTGCAGFIGTNFVKKIASKPEMASHYHFHIIDALTYAGKKENIEAELKFCAHLSFEKMDIRDRQAIAGLFQKRNFSGVINFAAESHVDRSIENPNIFVETNVLGTLNLLQASLGLQEKSNDFRFLQISTDEVYGSLGEKDPAFTENTPIAPNSPYSSSKASADLLCRSFFETYKLPVMITRCSNNYGPYQADEKFIPVVIKKALRNEKVPVYGAGMNVRDWIFVDDHNDGVWSVFEKGRAGHIYNFGGAAELPNIELAKKILKILGKPESLIEFVTDRKGHDFRYAMNFNKSQRELGWRPQHQFDDALTKTVQWYQSHHVI
jgi:dTDP-glucose 4,6-dehydratase